MIDWFYLKYWLKKRDLVLVWQHFWKETKLYFLMGFSLLGVLIFIWIVLCRHYETRGATLKSRQIGAVADHCYSVGGILLINNKKGGLELECIKMQIKVEMPVDCSEKEELINRLIERDYKRLRLNP